MSKKFDLSKAGKSVWHYRRSFDSAPWKSMDFGGYIRYLISIKFTNWKPEEVDHLVTNPEVIKMLEMPLEELSNYTPKI